MIRLPWERQGPIPFRVLSKLLAEGHWGPVGKPSVQLAVQRLLNAFSPTQLAQRSGYLTLDFLRLKMGNRMGSPDVQEVAMN